MRTSREWWGFTANSQTTHTCRACAHIFICHNRWVTRGRRSTLLTKSLKAALLGAVVAMSCTLGGCAAISTGAQTGPAVKPSNPALDLDENLVDTDSSEHDSALTSGCVDANCTGQWTAKAARQVSMPADFSRQSQPPCPTVSTPHQVTAARSGSAPDLKAMDKLSSEESVPVYVDQLSAACGDFITIHVGSLHNVVVIVRALRIGWYNGRGSDLVWSSEPIQVTGAGYHVQQGSTIGPANFPTTVTTQIDSSWQPGLYAIVTDVGNHLAGAAELVVRNDATRRKAIIIYSSFTHSAYSPFGGASLYHGYHGSPRALEVSLSRPLIGGGERSFLAFDVPCAQILDRAGLVVDSVSDIDINNQPSLLTGRAEIVLPGHSEYWTKRMYDALTVAHNQGTNIVDLGANEIYWQARIRQNPSGPGSYVFVARDQSLDPLAATAPALTTVQWRAKPLLRDPSTILGESYTAAHANGSLQTETLPTWLPHVTGLTRGSVLHGVATGEVDGPQLGPGFNTPPNLQIIALGVLHGPAGRQARAAITYFTSANGAAVFQTGSTDWACHLTNACFDSMVSTQTRQLEWAITSAVLHDLYEPQWGRQHPSVGSSDAAIQKMSRALAPAASGSF